MVGRKAIGRKGESLMWTGTKIMLRAPQASGVYAIFSTREWLYVGETGDIRASLLAHFDDHSSPILQNNPIGFQFEVTPTKQRAARKKQLIAELKPICN